MVASIRAEGFDNSHVMEAFNHLTNVIGPRLTNSLGYYESVEWTRDKMVEWGFEDVHLEPWEFGRGWTLDKFSIEMLEPKVIRTRGIVVLRNAVPNSKRAIVGRVVAPSGLAVLTINGVETKPAANGIFKSSVAIPDSGTGVRVVAVDQDGGRDRIEFMLQVGDEGAPSVSSRTPSLPRGRISSITNTS